MRAAPMLAFVLLAPIAFAEAPTDGSCDSTGLLVCAGADAGAHVVCTQPSPSTATCTWTRGAIWQGFSRAGLPGNITATSAGDITLCPDYPANCTTTILPADLNGACSWIGPLTCDGGGLKDGSFGPISMVLGQCIRVVVHQEIDVEAHVIDGVTELSNTTFRNVDEGADEVCYVDNGR